MTKALIIKQRKNTISLIKNNLMFVIIIGVFLFGMLIGSFSVSVCEDNNFFGIRSYFNSYVDFLSTSDFKTVFLNTLLSLTLLILVNYISGLCVVGNFFISFLLFLFAFGIGSVSAFLYRCYSLTGICFFTLVILPGLFIFCITYILSFIHSFKFSARLFALVKKNNSVSVDFGKYSVKHVMFFILTVLSCVINAFITVNFISVFDF